MPKNIVFLSRLYWPHGGGVETHVAGLSRELIKRGHRITVVTEQFDEQLKLKEKHEGVTIVRIPYSALVSKQKVWSWMEGQRELFEAADLIHIHDVFWWYLPLRFKLKTPVYTTFHGYEGSKPPRWQAVVHRKLVEILSKGTICVGDFMKKWYRANPTVVTYGAADVTTTPLPPARTAVFLGRLAEDTGIMTYLQAIQIIKPDLVLDVYGEGPELEAVKIMIKQKHLPVALHGWTEKPESVLRKSRYAFVSRYLAILEAMQTKRLVVAVYNNEIKRDYLFCHPAAKEMLLARSAQELATKLQDLTPVQENTMINQAYVWAKTQTWDALADTYLKLWQKQ